MATATAWSSVLDQLLDERPGLGWKFTGTSTASGATTTTTDPEINKLFVTADERYQSLFLYIPSAVAGSVNQIRSLTTASVSGGTATLTGRGNFDATFTAVTHYLLAIHPDVLRRLGNDALELEYHEILQFLYHGPDSGDMQGSTVDTDWTETNATDSTQTTDAEVFSGVQSFVITDSGSGGGYSQSGLSPIGQGKAAHCHFILKADTGTSTPTVLDGSGNVQDSIPVTSEDWVYAYKRVQFDAADEQIRLRLTGTSASAAGDWQLACFVKEGNGRFTLPEFIDRRYKVRAVCTVEFTERAAEADTWLADSMVLTRLKPGEDYRINIRQGDAKPNVVYFTREAINRGVLSKLLCLVVDEPWTTNHGVSGTFSTDDSTTLCPFRPLVERCKQLIGKRYPRNFPGLDSEGADEVMQSSILDSQELPKRELRIRSFFG